MIGSERLERLNDNAEGPCVFERREGRNFRGTQLGWDAAERVRQTAVQLESPSWRGTMVAPDSIGQSRHEEVSMSFDVRALTLAGKLVFLAILLSILVAILFGSFSLILPAHQWTVWRVPILIAAGGAVALTIAWPSYSRLRPWVMDNLAAVLSLASAIPGIGIALLFAYGLGLQIAEHRGSVDSLIYKMTNPMALWYYLCFAMIPVVPGAVSLWIVRRRLLEVGRVSLAGMAARFSKLGLGLSATIGAGVAVAALCRRVMWP
jgi:hypothetical protein